MDKTTYALKRALNLIDYLEYEKGLYFHGDRDVIREALANIALGSMSENERELGVQMRPAQQQEPVAVVKALPMGHNQPDMHYAECQHLPVGTPLYTSPPASKPWVGLTDEEVSQLAQHELWIKNFIRQVESKLRSKNA